MSKTIEEYFRSEDKRVFSAGEIFVTKYKHEFMLVYNSNMNYSMVQLDGGLAGHKQGDDITYDVSSRVPIRDVMKMIGCAKFTVKSDGKTYDNSRSCDIRMPFGTKLRGSNTGNEYTLVKTYSNNNEYGSLVRLPSMQADMKMAKVSSTDGITKDELERIAGCSSSLFTVI